MRRMGPLAFGLFIAIVAIAVLWFLPAMIVGPLSPDPPIRSSDVANLNGVRTAIAAVLVGVGALGTLYVNAQNQKTSSSSYSLAVRGQLTDRYAKCVELLGSENPEVRIGGLFGLEQFAAESLVASDQGLVVAILSSFIRRQTFSDQYGEDDEFVPVNAEVQVALTILGRLPFRAGIARADLRGAVLYRAELRGADLRGALLDGAFFNEANLSLSDLRGCTFYGAHFYGTNLERATISNADYPADYSGAVFRAATLSAATLTHGAFFHSDFRDAQLSGADFTSSRLAGSSLAKATVAAVSRHDPSALIYDGGRATASEKFGPAILRGADLTDVQGLDPVSLRECVLDEKTLLSGDLKQAMKGHKWSTVRQDHEPG